jgi:hypothetical protein
MNSLTNATNALSKTEEWILTDKIFELANWFYGLEPARTDIESKIESAKTIEDLNALKEEIVKSDSVALFNAWNDKKIKLS